MLLSACLIVKNEGLTLERCLTSLEGVVDEIIVVDTGSTDNTVEIAQQFTPLVFEYQWDNDFSRARNESLKHAQGQYILHIDGDEFLDSREKLMLRDGIMNSDSGGFYVRVRNYAGSVQKPVPNTDMIQLRIFRRGYEYEGSLHEQIAYALMRNNETITELPLTIHHFGYLNELVAMRGKIQRNLPIAVKNWGDNPDDIYNRTSLMGEYARAGLYEECIPLGETLFEELRTSTPQEDRLHLYTRGLVFLIISMRATGRYDKACVYASESVERFPWSLELQQQLADSLFAVGRFVEAIGAYQHCRDMGEPAFSWIDTPRGLGSFWAAESLARVWGFVGDSSQSLKWYLTAFYENPATVSVISPLVYLLPRDARLLSDRVESHINDKYVYMAFAETCVRLGLDNVAHVLARMDDKFGHEASTRARLGMAAREGYERLQTLVSDIGTEEAQRLLAIYELNQGDTHRATERLHELQLMGNDILEIHHHVTTNNEEPFFIVPILPELMLMGAEKLLEQWLPKAVDRNDVWLHVYYSEFAPNLLKFEWSGKYVWECELTARRLFSEREWEKATEWLERAMKFSPTVTKVIIEADLALAHNNLEHARSVLKMGQAYFPESEILGQVIENLSHVDNTYGFKEDNGMNPTDVYRRTAVQTMPFNVQLAQLHERGALLTQLVKELSEAGQVNAMRKNIEEMQDILTFLRSSLDSRLEVSQITDQTYAYIYKILVQWFLQPSIETADYDVVLEFWTTWAQTWKKVTAQGNSTPAGEWR